MVIIPAEQSDTGQTTMGLRKLTVTNATKTDTGWRIVAQTPDRIVRFLDVDEEGFGSDCEPWDDEWERKFGEADPEHNVVMLEPERPAAPKTKPEQPSAEVIDITEKWAERDSRINSVIEGVNAIQDLDAVAEQRANIKKFSAQIDELILVARTPEQQEVARQLERWVAIYKEVTPRTAHQMVPNIEEMFLTEGAYIRGEEPPQLPRTPPPSLDFMAREVFFAAMKKVDQNRNSQVQEWNEALAQAEARKANRHGNDA